MTPIQLAILRRALLPVLADDECYPPGELPRRMSEDEVRHHDGSALKMTMLKAYGGEPYVHISLPVDSYSWDPGSDVHELADSHPARVIGQWHRLQSFWDKHQRVQSQLGVRCPHGHVLGERRSAIRLLRDMGRKH
jgi:hypothetical protein